MKIITRMEKIVGSLKHLPWTLPWLNASTSWRNIEEDEERAVLLSTMYDPLPVLLRTMFAPMVHPSIPSPTDESLPPKRKRSTHQRLSKVIRRMQIFSDYCEWCQVYFTNYHAGKGKAGPWCISPAGNKSTLKSFPQMSFTIKTELFCACAILLPFFNLLKYDYCFPVLPSPYYYFYSVTWKGYCNETLSHYQWFELGRWSRND